MREGQQRKQAIWLENLIIAIENRYPITSPSAECSLHAFTCIFNEHQQYPHTRANERMRKKTELMVCNGYVRASVRVIEFEDTHDNYFLSQNFINVI